MPRDVHTLAKLADPYNFIKAEEFFQNLDQAASGVQFPTAVCHTDFDGQGTYGGRGLHLTFDDGSLRKVHVVSCHRYDLFWSNLES